MSFSFSGTSDSRLLRLSGGNGASLSAWTATFWAKRTSSWDARYGMLLGLRPTGDATGHDLLVNDPNSGTRNRLILQANYASAQANSEIFPLNAWVFVALVGSGANISLKYWDGSAFIDDTVGQTAFVPNKLFLGDIGGTTGWIGKIAHIRIWDAALNETELTAEKNSATRVRTTSLVSAHSGTGANIAAAIVGEFGTAFTNVGGVTLDAADNPTFTSFTGVTVSGDSEMPGTVPSAPTGSRSNYILHSGNLANAVWSKQSNLLIAGAVAAPAGYGASQRVQFKNAGGGVYQMMTGLPEGRFTAVMAVRRVDADYLALKHTKSDFGSGVRVVFNLITGAWENAIGIGSTPAPVSATDLASRSIGMGTGWFLVWVASSIPGDRGLEFYLLSSPTGTIALDKSVDVAAFQYEEAPTSGVALATYHKPTTSVAVTRQLAGANVVLSTPILGVGQSGTATLQLVDGVGAPWDQYPTPILTSSSPSIATVTLPAGTKTDLSGRAAGTVLGVAEGSTNITGSGGEITSAPAVQQISNTQVSRIVRILVEPGWEGTSGWKVGVYLKHSTDLYPTTKSFEVPGQTFQSQLSNGYSRMDVSVPSAITLTAGTEIEVVLKNDNVNGSAVDGPATFMAEVLAV